MLLALILSATVVQARLSRSRIPKEKPPEVEKVFVELGFEGENDKPEVSQPEKTEDEVPNDEFDSEESIETFYDIEYEPNESSPNARAHDQKPDSVERVNETQPPPLFEVSYEATKQEGFDSPLIVIENEDETDHSLPETDPMFTVHYEESDPVVIETDSIILETEEDADNLSQIPKKERDPLSIYNEVSNPILEVESDESEYEHENREETLAEDATHGVVEVDLLIDESEKNLRKPFRNESDPDVNTSMGVKTCINCGSEVPDTTYCIYCGKSIEVKETEQ
jgi:hypothetical protein